MAILPGGGGGTGEAIVGNRPPLDGSGGGGGGTAPATTTTVEITPSYLGWTVGDVVTHFTGLFDNGSDAFKDRIKNAIRIVYRDYLHRWTWDWLRSSDALSIRAGVAQYPLPADCANIDSDLFIANQLPVTRRTIQNIRAWNAVRPEAGVPIHFALDSDRTLVLWPTPDADYSAVFDYLLFVADPVEDESSLLVPPYHQHAILTGVEELLRRYDDRHDVATRVVGMKYLEQVGQLVFRETSGRTVMMEPDDPPPGVGW